VPGIREAPQPAHEGAAATRYALSIDGRWPPDDPQSGYPLRRTSDCPQGRSTTGRYHLWVKVQHVFDGEGI